MLAAAARMVRDHRAPVFCALLVALSVVGLFGSARAPAQSNTDRAFLSWAIQIEIQQQDMGRIAERRARTAAVRALGSYLVERHRQAEQRLREVAMRLNVPLSDTLSATHLRVQSRFSSIPGAGFDRGFIQHEIGDYRYFLSHFKAAASSGSPLIRQYAASELAPLEEDQAKIMALARQDG
jgi:putative membrane protein